MVKALKFVSKKPTGTKGTALVLASGVGRYNKIYSDLFENVYYCDLIDEFLSTPAYEHEGAHTIACDINRVFDFVPSNVKFDYVDVQWGLCFVEGLPDFINQLKTTLNPGAVVFVKENYLEDNEAQPQPASMYGTTRAKTEIRYPFGNNILFEEEIKVWIRCFVLCW